MCAWIWMKCCMSTNVGTWTNNKLLSPIWIIAWMPELHCFLRYHISAARHICCCIEPWFKMVLWTTAGDGYWAPVTAAMHGFESYALQRRILLCQENPTYRYWERVLGARRSSNAWIWGVETPLLEVNALYWVPF